MRRTPARLVHSQLLEQPQLVDVDQVVRLERLYLLLPQRDGGPLLVEEGRASDGNLGLGQIQLRLVVGNERVLQRCLGLVLEHGDVLLSHAGLEGLGLARDIGFGGIPRRVCIGGVRSVAALSV